MARTRQTQDTQSRKEDLKEIKRIQKVVEDIATSEILPLIKVEEIKINVPYETEDEKYLKQLEKAKEQAYFMALRIVMKNEIKLQGGLTLEEIGIMLGNVTRERVRQIEQNAIKKLSHPKFGFDLKRYINMSVRVEESQF